MRTQRRWRGQHRRGDPDAWRILAVGASMLLGLAVSYGVIMAAWTAAAHEAVCAGWCWRGWGGTLAGAWLTSGVGYVLWEHRQARFLAAAFTAGQCWLGSRWLDRADVLAAEIAQPGVQALGICMGGMGLLVLVALTGGGLTFAGANNNVPLLPNLLLLGGGLIAGSLLTGLLWLGAGRQQERFWRSLAARPDHLVAQ